MTILPAALASAITITSAGAFQSDLIDRTVLFGNPERAGVQISPDGARLGFLAPHEGVLNVWIAPAADPANARRVTSDSDRGIRQYFWAHTSEHVIYLQDVNGDENWQIVVVDLATGEELNLTPIDSIVGPDGEPIRLPGGDLMRPAARVIKVSDRFPTEIVIGLNDRNPMFHDVYRVNILTGERTLVERNDMFLGYVIDDDFNVRFASQMTPDAGVLISRRIADRGWAPFVRVEQEDMLSTNPVGFDRTGRLLYMIDSRDRNTAAAVAVDTQTGETTLIAHDPRADIDALFIHPRDRTVQAVGSTYKRREWQILDKTIEPDVEFLRDLDHGDIMVNSRTLDDSLWVVAYAQDAGPMRYYLYNRDERGADFLFTDRPALEGLTLSPMEPVVIPSRDGLDLISYLTLPARGVAEGPHPAVLLVHGGPWARDTWGFNPLHQWLANRGYAVLSVNFRGSTGFGKDFINASNREWGGKMHDDLIDGVRWLVDRGIADPDRVAIMGGSYGGYATLVGLTFTPDVFACGVDIVGPSNLRTLLETIPPYWKPLLDLWAVRVGDPRTEEGRAFLDSRSPLTHVDRIQRPLLIGQGANDPRVKQSESDQIVEEMQRRAIPVTYVLYPDEGHGFARPENRMSFFAVTEAFLSEHIGGRAQPIGGDLEGSSIRVLEGADQITGLSEALAR